ncbi:hypothetical protein F53441_4033 [Fusarium austroafricanum]|uniref:Uncharacterized protein n=1 Tax=Fusarium austroafricanum TaxID=2364996 RepID=A0A8H4P159_9HYPO|nr:hypothetical protein F53441_4033 [Fusarium austroafricanum]
MDVVILKPKSPFWVLLVSVSESVGGVTTASELDELAVATEPEPSGSPVVVFQLGITVSLRVEPDVTSETVGRDTLGNGKGNDATVPCFIPGAGWPLEALVGTEALPPEWTEVFQLGPKLLPELANEGASVGGDNVGNEMIVPLDIPTVGTKLLFLGMEVVPFQLGPTLPLAEFPGLVEIEIVGNATEVPPEKLAVGTEPLPLGAEVVFQPGPTLPLGKLRESADSEIVGSGTKDPVIVGTEPLPPDVEAFQLGPTLSLADISSDNEPFIEGVSVLVPEMLLGMVALEFHPVKVDPVGRVSLSKRLHDKFPEMGDGNESLVMPDHVIPAERVSDS